MSAPCCVVCGTTRNDVDAFVAVEREALVCCEEYETVEDVLVATADALWEACCEYNESNSEDQSLLACAPEVRP